MVSSALKTTINKLKDNQNDRKKKLSGKIKKWKFPICVVYRKPIRSENRFGVACIRKM